MKGITELLHDIMEHLLENPYDYKYGTLIITHDMEERKDIPDGILKIEFDDINGNHLGMSSVFSEKQYKK